MDNIEALDFQQFEIEVINEWKHCLQEHDVSNVSPMKPTDAVFVHYDLHEEKIPEQLRSILRELRDFVGAGYDDPD